MLHILVTGSAPGKMSCIEKRKKLELSNLSYFLVSNALMSSLSLSEWYLNISKLFIIRCHFAGWLFLCVPKPEDLHVNEQDYTLTQYTQRFESNKRLSTCKVELR